MDCRNFRDVLDSYLSGELAVESNHAILQHAECCAVCRDEMAARRHLRASLRSACTRAKLSAECSERLRASLQTEGVQRGSIFTRLFIMRFPLTVAAAAGLLLILGAALSIYLFQLRPVAAAELSPALIYEAVGDHDGCGSHYTHAPQGPVQMSKSARQYDPAYDDLDKVAGAGAEGMQLRAAHVCGFAGRRFAHLVYARESQLISLLVTERDGRALRRGVVPLDDGLRAGLQQVLRDPYTVCAYQTAKHVVLVVSPLPEAQNKELAERMAQPVCDYLRRLETHPPPQ